MTLPRVCFTTRLRRRLSIVLLALLTAAFAAFALAPPTAMTAALPTAYGYDEPSAFVQSNYPSLHQLALVRDPLAQRLQGGLAAVRLAGLFGVAAEELAPEAAGAAGRGPDFIVHPNGEAIPVPEGATGPTPVRTGKGVQFTGGSGGHGLDPRVMDVRVMDPVTTGKYPYPNGYVSYSNAAGQAVNPYTGQTLARSDPWWHWAWSQ